MLFRLHFVNAKNQDTKMHYEKEVVKQRKTEYEEALFVQSKLNLHYKVNYH
jgi:hypothetical protein